MAKPGELWQAYDESGKPIQNSGLTRRQCRDGALHAAAHVWIWRRQAGKIQVLVQTRHPDKPTWPNHFDISAAGHVDLGETPLQAAIRETQEEIGVMIEPEQLKELFVHRARLQANDEVVENEFQFVYVLEFDNQTIQIDSEEVAATKWLDLVDFKLLCQRGKYKGLPIVDHGEVYFDRLLGYLESVV
jgi:isopentenyldiphosphate isomerase